MDQNPPQPPTPHTVFHPEPPASAPEPPTPPLTPPSPMPQPQPVAPPPMTPMPPSSPGPAYGATPFSAQPPKKSKKKLVFISILLVTFLALSAGTVFGYYLPNRPENIWKTSLDHTGQALTSLVNESTEENTLNAFKKVQITASVNAVQGDTKLKGEFDAKVDSTHAAGSLKITDDTVDSDTKTFSTKFMEERKDSDLVPDVYLQFSGLKSFGVSNQYPALTAYEGKWLIIDKDFLKSMGLGGSAKAVGDTELKPSQTVKTADYADAAKDLSAVITEYVLTGDQSKSILEQRGYLGKEEVDGKTAYHYTLGINQANVPAFCQALVNKTLGTKLYSKMVPENSGQSKEAYVKDCVDSSKDSQKTTYDIWMDAKYKMIYKVRSYEDDKKTYTEIGQNYDGGDNVSLFVKDHDDTTKADATVKLKVNLKSHKVTGSVSLSGADSQSQSLDASLAVEPYSGTIDTTKPAGAIPIQEVLAKLGLSASDL